jgi:hypothetical protein
VFYDRPGRAAGETKYPISKMLRLALDAITSFSVLPLRFSTYLGMFISLASVLTAGWALLERFVFKSTVPWWTATVVLLALLSSVQLLMIGILGEYVGRIYEQVKCRPLYLVSETLNLRREVDTDELDEVDGAALRASPPSPGFPESFPSLREPEAGSVEVPESESGNALGPPKNPMKQTVYETGAPPPPQETRPLEAIKVPPEGFSSGRSTHPLKGTLMGLPPRAEDLPSSRAVHRMKSTLMGVSPVLSPQKEEGEAGTPNDAPPSSPGGNGSSGPP